MSQENPTIGEQRVRVNFNPGGQETVNEVKREVANLIDLLETLKDPEPRSERNRCFAIAMTELETACMYAVKGMTA